MPFEVESRLLIGEDRIERVAEELARRQRIGRCALRPGERRLHADTYFDAGGRLHAMGWSLRVRRTADEIRLTLKRPAPDAPDGGAAVVRHELESGRDGSFGEVLAQVAHLLHSAGVLEAETADVDFRILRDGAVAALIGLGLQDLFTVETDRRTWCAVGADGGAVAEIALDDSTYTTGGGGPVREGRLEVELLDGADRSALTALTAELRSAFDAEEAFDSKFDRGLVHYRTRNLHDKMETKVTLGEADDYHAVIRRLEGTEPFVQGHRFVRTSLDRHLTDVYFDTRNHALFKLGWYLRLRREGEQAQLTFRRMTADVRYGQVLQQEITAASRPDGEGDAVFGTNWTAIKAWLVSCGGVSEQGDPERMDQAETVLARMGLHRSLETSIVRTAWVVERVLTDAAPGSPAQAEHVAKLKYDRVTYRVPGSEDRAGGPVRDPDRQRPPLRDVEFEVTGVEDETAAPQSLQHDSYHSFLALFVEACAHVATDRQADQRISAKYFNGLVRLGVVPRPPRWLTDGRLALRVVLLRESDAGRGPMAHAHWAAVRFWVGLSVLICGLFGISTGADGGIWTAGADTPGSWWSTGVQALGFLAVVGGSVILFRGPAGPWSTQSRILVVAAGVVAAVAVSIPWFGRHASADAVAFLGLLPLLLSLGKDGLGRS